MTLKHSEYIKQAGINAGSKPPIACEYHEQQTHHQQRQLQQLAPAEGAIGLAAAAATAGDNPTLTLHAQQIQAVAAHLRRTEQPQKQLQQQQQQQPQHQQPQHQQPQQQQRGGRGMPTNPNSSSHWNGDRVGVDQCEGVPGKGNRASTTSQQAQQRQQGATITTSGWRDTVTVQAAEGRGRGAEGEGPTKRVLDMEKVEDKEAAGKTGRFPPKRTVRNQVRLFFCTREHVRRVRLSWLFLLSVCRACVK